MINLVITGALGHIGSRFIRELPADLINHVVLLDNLSTQRYPALFDLSREISFVFHEADVCTDDLDQYFVNADVVVHLAAITNAESSFAIRDQIEHTNFIGTQKVAEACARNGCKLVFISTTSVYRYAFPYRHQQIYLACVYGTTAHGLANSYGSTTSLPGIG